MRKCIEFTIEPPYTERYVRWCGRSVTQLMGDLLPDLVLGTIVSGKGEGLSGDSVTVSGLLRAEDNLGQDKDQ